ncbi:MAG: cation diffusion facilitator family transporter [Actinobacteria bacterium]|nr:cation diffusion facilitator family transporter [Actinomycetota bacterium]
MTDTHEHGSDLRQAQRRALWVALAINGAYLGVEIVGGIAFNSLALLADAGHMLSDVVGLGIALIAQGLLSRPASARHTFGFQRAEVLGALANAVTLVAVVGWIFFEAAGRLSDPEPIEGAGLLIVAVVGLAVNVVSAVILARARGHSLNMHGAFLHMASDAAGSVAVIIAAVAVIVWDATWVDPLASLAIGLLILWATWGLLRDTVHVLMEGAPKNLDAEEVEEVLASQPSVGSVHHLHMWNLASDTPAMSAHVVLLEDESLHQAQIRGDELKALLHKRFGIEHSTLELECHPCFEVAEERSRQ